MLGILEEVHNLGNLDLSLGKACHILEGHLAVVILVKEARLGLADAEDSSTGTTGTHAPVQQRQEQDEQYWRRQIQYHVGVITGLVILDGASVHAVGLPLLGFVVKLVGAGNLRRDHVGGALLAKHGALGRLGFLIDLICRRVGQHGLEVILIGINRHGLDTALVDDAVELRP